MEVHLLKNLYCLRIRYIIYQHESANMYIGWSDIQYQTQIVEVIWNALLTTFGSEILSNSVNYTNFNQVILFGYKKLIINLKRCSECSISYFEGKEDSADNEWYCKQCWLNYTKIETNEFDWNLFFNQHDSDYTEEKKSTAAAISPLLHDIFERCNKNNPLKFTDAQFSTIQAIVTSLIKTLQSKENWMIKMTQLIDLYQNYELSQLRNERRDVNFANKEIYQAKIANTPFFGANDSCSWTSRRMSKSRDELIKSMEKEECNYNNSQVHYFKLQSSLDECKPNKVVNQGKIELTHLQQNAKLLIQEYSIWRIINAFPPKTNIISWHCIVAKNKILWKINVKQGMQYFNEWRFLYKHGYISKDFSFTLWKD
eukprot:476171_1